MIRRILYLTVLSAVCLIRIAAQEQSPQSVRDLVREYRQQHEADIVRGYAQLLSLPNVASDTANIKRNADAISTLLEERGFHTQLLNVNGAPPVVYGELSTPGAKHTLLFYAHYDGQPVDKTQWASDPWQPVLRDGPADGKVIPLENLQGLLNPEWRIYARSASDDKAPIQAAHSYRCAASGENFDRRES
jgi:acetylornithine deacetylase/succinyl-diaminopimelate desuccinylase-like protein